MKRILPEFEHHTQPLIPMDQFLRRVANSGILALGIITASLLIGMVGYRSLEGLSWMDAFLNSAMLLGGMGPVNTPITGGGKLFAGSVCPLLRHSGHIGGRHYFGTSRSSHSAPLPS